MNVNGLEYATLFRYLMKWCLLATLLGLITGSACALFLRLLDVVTELRFANAWLLWLLPAAGAVVGIVYSRFGKTVESGNNLIMEEIHEPGGGVPLRMAPLVLMGTLVTHLFGGSAGREGTAVQMGGSLAGGLARIIPGLDRRDVQMLLMAGIAAGFSGVFGTPVAGMIFSLEVLTVGRMSSAAIVPCLIAAFSSDQTCAAWGIGHTHYDIATRLPTGSNLHLAPFDARLMMMTIVAGIAFGLASALFAGLTHRISDLFRKALSLPVLRPVLGGVLVIGLTQLVGTADFLGLGVSSPDRTAVTIVSSFRCGGAETWSWFWKLVFTAVTLGSGFKGGEVTPLFFVGAALGNTLATLFGLPVDLFAALGFVSVFAGATNTPLACTVMAVELFGGEHVHYFAVSCLVAYLFSSHAGIYSSQRTDTPKPGLRKQGGDEAS